ncbi:MAG: ABC transporter substrate-binding protein [Candidatus Thorarchaeota archaeon]
MRKKIQKQIMSIILFILFVQTINLLILPEKNSSAHPGPFFSINVTSVGEDLYRDVFLNKLNEYLPRIGIAVNAINEPLETRFFEERINNHITDIIPQYSDGGYDLFINKHRRNFEFIPYDFSSSSIGPKGLNIYHYQSEEFDSLFNAYINDFSQSSRINYLDELENLLIEDLPVIPLCNQHYHLPTHNTFVSYLLWANTYKGFPIRGNENPNIVINSNDFDNFYPYKNYIFTNLTAYYSQMKYNPPWQNLIYYGLIDYNYDGSWIPCLAEEYTTSDGKKYSINLNPNAKFADGTSVTADDVVYSYQTASYIYNETFNQNINYGWNNNSVVKLDDFQIEITFNESNILNEEKLSLPIIPKHIWEKIAVNDHITQAEYWSKNNVSQIIGFGPYKLSSYDPLSKIITLEDNPFFNDFQPSSFSLREEINFYFSNNKEEAITGFQNGTYSMINHSFDLDYFWDIYSNDLLSTFLYNFDSYEIAINLNHPYLGTGALCPIVSPNSAKYIRKAINSMIQRDLSVDDPYYFGRGSPIPIGTIGYTETNDAVDYNYNYAVFCMENAGFSFDTNNGQNWFDYYGIVLLFLLSIVAIPLLCLGFTLTFSIISKKKQKRISSLSRTIITCHTCGVPIRYGANICPNCSNKIPYCMLCSLPIIKSEILGICPNCQSSAHIAHIQDWLEDKSTCPHCSAEITMKDILIKGIEEE